MQPQVLFDKLLFAYGKQNWWPVTDKGAAKPSYKPRASLSEAQKFEVCVGAILTQNTSWKNVEKAIEELHKNKMLSVRALAKAKRSRIAKLIRSSGYFNQKAERLQLFCRYLQKNYGGSLGKMLSKPLAELRIELLSLKGIGPETADSIILYAAGKPSFVIDAYTRRLAERLWKKKNASYEELKTFFESRLPSDAKLFNEFHALIVEHAKQNCRKTPLCNGCFLSSDCRNSVNY